MPFCPNCGKETSGTAAFCSGCGYKFESKSTGNTATTSKVELKSFLEVLKSKFSADKMKSFFSPLTLNCNTWFFKLATILCIAFVGGKDLFNIIFYLLPVNLIKSINSTDYGRSLISFTFCTLIAVIAALIVFVLKRKSGNIQKQYRKSNALYILWSISAILNLLVFFVSEYDYILYANIATCVIELALVIFTLLLIKRNHASVFVTIASTILIVLNYVTLLGMQLAAMPLNNEYLTFDFWFAATTFGLPALVFVLLIIGYLLPRSIYKWTAAILFVALMSFNIVDSFSSLLSIYGILQFAKDTIITLMAIWFMSSLKKSNCRVPKEAGLSKKDNAKIILRNSIISVVITVLIVLIYVLISAFVCSAKVNNTVEKWKADIQYGHVVDDADWDSLQNDFYINVTKPAKQFIDDYATYETIKKYAEEMQQICQCHSAYMRHSFTSEIAETYSNIYISDDFKENELVSYYYNMYIQMQPSVDNVSIDYKSVNVNSGKITVTVKNNNVLPVSKCFVKVDFTIVYIEGGYYSGTEYGRGTQYITVSDIPGSGRTATQTIDFDPSAYYNSYGSYMMASLMSVSAEITGIE